MKQFYYDIFVDGWYIRKCNGMDLPIDISYLKKSDGWDREKVELIVRLLNENNRWN